MPKQSENNAGTEVQLPNSDGTEQKESTEVHLSTSGDSEQKCHTEVLKSEENLNNVRTSEEIPVIRK